MDSAARQALSSIAFLAASVAGRASQVAAHAVIARALGVEGFGLYALGWTVLQLGQSVGHLGLTDGVVRLLPRYRGVDSARVKSILLRALGLSILAGCVLAGLLAAFGEELADHVFAKPRVTAVLLALAPALAVAPVMHVAAAATRATGAMRYSIITVEAGLPILLLMAACGLWLAGPSVVAMALATSVVVVGIAMAALTQVWWLYRADLTPASAPTREPDRLLSFSLSALSLGVTTLLMLWSDRLFIGAFRPAVEVGAYHAASQISMLLIIVFWPLSAVLAPFAAAAAWETRRDELRRAYQDVYRWALYLAGPAAALVLEFADLILVSIYGPAFAVATQPARVLIAGQLVYLLGGAAGTLLVMTGHERLWLIHAATAVGVNLALNGLLVPRYGMLGAAVATAIALAALQGGGCLLVRLRLGFWPLTRPLASALAVGALVMALGTIAIHAAIAAPAGWLRTLPPMTAIVALTMVVIGSGAHRVDLEILWSLLRWRTGLEVGDQPDRHPVDE